MSNKRFESILIIAVTLLYCAFFYFNCMIIPYTGERGKEIVHNPQRPLYDDVLPPADGDIRLIGDTNLLSEAFKAPLEASEPLAISKSMETPEFPQLSETSEPSKLSGEATFPGATEPLKRTDSAETLQRSLGIGEVQRVQSSSAVDTKETGSRVLLSGNRASKALSSVSLKDKLWLIKLLSRCSMEELLQIRSMLKGDITYEKNLEMYRIMRRNITHEEQAKLDALIKKHAK